VPAFLHQKFREQAPGQEQALQLAQEQAPVKNCLLQPRTPTVQEPQEPVVVPLSVSLQPWVQDSPSSRQRMDWLLYSNQSWVVQAVPAEVFGVGGAIAVLAGPAAHFRLAR
jgi:hypothetical protein